MWFQSIIDFYKQNITYIEFTEALITFATTIISVLIFWRTKRMERRLFGKAESVPGPIVDAAAMVIDFKDLYPFSMVQRVRQSIYSDVSLREKIDEADPIPGYENIPLNQGIFKLGYVICERDGQKGSGRYLTITASTALPSNSDDAENYLKQYVSFLRSVNARLSRSGIKQLHIFYKGPIPMMAQFCIMFANTLDLKLYHYNNGKYYFVGSGKYFQVENDSEKQKKIRETHIMVPDLKEDGSPCDRHVCLSHLQASISKTEEQTQKVDIKDVKADSNHQTADI